MIRPEYISKGDTIAVVSPSYHLDTENFAKAVDYVRTLGFTPLPAPGSRDIFSGLYAGTPRSRADQLLWAYSNPDVKAIMAARGGYGAIQLLEMLPESIFRDSPKWLIGYSDITCLHSASVAAGVMSIHGIMGSSLAEAVPDPESVRLTCGLLCGDVPEYSWSPEVPGYCGSASGMLVGGNLATMVPLAGTPYGFFGEDGDIILFVEDVGESARNIDRMFNILKLHGVMDRVRGMILGDFTDCGDEFGFRSIENMLLSFTLDRDIPVACSFPAGHGGRNFPLIEGARVSLEVDCGSARLKFLDV